MNSGKPPSLDQLIEEYKSLPQYCANVNYVDDAAIKQNNKSVKRMIKIVGTVRKLGPAGINRLIALLDIEEHNTNLWIATHLLEQVDVDKKTEEKAMTIIKRVSSAHPVLKISYEHWLKMYSGE